VALANQLGAELDRFWPRQVGVFFAIDSPISLAWLLSEASDRPC
jgi:hypothetical protein